MPHTVVVQHGDRSAEVDPILAPLLLSLWGLDIEALHATVEEDGLVYLYLGDQEDVEMMFTALDFDKDSDIYRRAMNSAETDCWITTTFPMDLREEKIEEDQLPFGLSFAVHFPTSDLDEVVKRLHESSSPCGECDRCLSTPPNDRLSN